MAEVTNQIKLQHLLWRAGFGPTLASMPEESTKSTKSALKSLVKASASFTPFHLVDENLLVNLDRKQMSPEEFRMMKKEAKDKIRDLNLVWLDGMANGKDVLRHKMMLFWHGHFACKSNNPYFTQQYLNTLQQHALGKFSDLLMAVSKCPAMLQFLNNQQNKKASPNENFAREVVELFTLGRGNYTEADIKNAARAFTGWGFNKQGEFVFRANQHDTDAKTFLGKTGSFTGEEVIQLIISKKETAQFVCGKVYRYFVNDKPDASRIKAMADRFYKSKYDITDLMEYVFSSDWFYDPQNIGSRIKSPIELITGLRRTFGLSFQDTSSLLFVQKMLGQMVLYPPNVAGWAEGKSWIDSSSLLFRMQLPDIIFKSSEILTNAKEDGDVETEHLSKRNSRTIMAEVNWAGLSQVFGSYQATALFDQLTAYLLQTSTSATNKTLIINRAKEATDNLAQTKIFTLSLSSLPEFQLC